MDLSCLVGAGGEIYLFAALGAFMDFFKFVGENFLGCAAFGAFAGKRLEFFEVFKSRAVLGCTHDDLLLS